MHLVRRSISLLRTLAILGALGCAGENLAPDDVTGTFALRQVGGDALPFAYATELSSFILLSDTVSLSATGRFGRVQVLRQVDAARGIDEIHVLRDSTTFERVGRALAVRYRCDPGANCMPPSRVWFRGNDQLLLDYEWDRVGRYVYARVR